MMHVAFFAYVDLLFLFFKNRDAMPRLDLKGERYVLYVTSLHAHALVRYIRMDTNERDTLPAVVRRSSTCACVHLQYM